MTRTQQDVHTDESLSSGDRETTSHPAHRRALMTLRWLAGIQTPRKQPLSTNPHQHPTQPHAGPRGPLELWEPRGQHSACSPYMVEEDFHPPEYGCQNVYLVYWKSSQKSRQGTAGAEQELLGPDFSDESSLAYGACAARRSYGSCCHRSARGNCRRSRNFPIIVDRIAQDNLGFRAAAEKMRFLNRPVGPFLNWASHSAPVNCSRTTRADTSKLSAHSHRAAHRRCQACRYGASIRRTRRSHGTASVEDPFPDVPERPCES